MTTVTIVPDTDDSDRAAYRARSGERVGVGRTAGEALDALTAQLPEEHGGRLVIVEQQRLDHLFTAEQQRRLADLMARWRAARDAGQSLPLDEQAELESLAEAEVRAAGERAAGLLAELDR